MKPSDPHPLPTRLLAWLLSGPHGEALVGDLIEQYRQGRTSAWYWRQAVFAIVVSAVRDPTGAGRAIIGWFLLLSLMIAGVARHPASIVGAGTRLLAEDLALLLAAGALAAWVWRQRGIDKRNALVAGGQTGLIIGMLFAVNHAIESFAPRENPIADLVRGAGVTMIMLAMFGVAGSAAWARTRSVLWGGLAGLWCACTATLFALTCAFALNYVFEADAIARLREAFLSSGMNDAGAFVARNSLRAASEALIRMPATAVVVGFTGALANAWLSARSRRLNLAIAWFMPLVLAIGAGALWHADSLERAARPPFIVTGLIAAGVALCGAHPLWSSLMRDRNA